MDLWIRSQYKGKLIKVENIQTNNESIICFTKTEGIIILGEYDNKERALEVLDEIQSYISILNVMSLCHNENMLIALNSAVGEKKLNNMSSPYEMPEE